MTPRRRALPLHVVGLGGNAICPPGGDLSFATQRALVRDAVAELALVARQGARLLIVHGNGPQVGRLLGAPGLGDPDSLDVHVAQTQGELGYLLAEALDAALGGASAAALVTRVLVDGADPAFAAPSKPVGAVLSEQPAGHPASRTPDGRGWRRVVASPRPVAVVEQEAIAALLRSRHVVAGGGGGVALAGEGPARRPCPAVVDKDWVAGLLARTLGAERLLFVTDVSHAFDRFGREDQARIHAMRAGEARHRLASGVFAAGSMAPKVESAVEFVEVTGRPAVITTLGSVEPSLRGVAGTTILP